MGCCGDLCGEPINKDNDLKNRTVPTPDGGVVTNQPTGQHGMGEPVTNGQWQQPNVQAPPVAYTQPGTMGNFQQQPNGWGQWGQGPSSGPQTQMRSQYSAYSLNGGNDPSGLMAPPSAFSHGSRNAPLLPTLPLGAPKERDEGRLSVSIDFGTTFSGVAYGSSRIAGGQVQQILNWPGSTETFRKIPTCLLYDEHGRVLAWGLEAKNAGPMAGTTKCEWFKLFLEPRALRDESAIDPRLPEIPLGKQALDLIVDFLACMWEYAKDQMTRDLGLVADLNTADVWLTVPAAWDAKGCEIMREAAIAAGLVASSRGDDDSWRDRLKIITEPEAAAVHCVKLSNLHHLKSSQNFMVCDAGGGTVDLAVYKIIGELANLEIAEICARSGANCGSIFLDLRFRELVKTLLSDHPAHLDDSSLAYFMNSFSETDKLNYTGYEDDDNIFYFTCFNVEDPQDSSVGLINGQLSIPGNLLRREVFDPVVNQVLQLIEDQLSKVDQPIHALLLVGGFAGSEYLKQRVEAQFQNRIRTIARPPDADTATLRGAAHYGLAKRNLVSSVISPRAYIMKVKLPADQEDWLKRPAYIVKNDAGSYVCQNRLKYLVSKGAIIRKGQRLTSTFCKYSHSPSDSSFVATMLTSDSDRIMRYIDEGELTELCNWTVDLTSLPTFKQNAAANMTGFYTEFELGLELDSAEIRGVLLHNGQECGRVVFDFRN